MVQLIVGRKGKGKTKHLLEKVNTEVKNVEGSIVYLDKSPKHMYELNNKVRLVNVSEYLIEDTDEFMGFVSGIISQDHDIQQMYFDSFINIAKLENNNMSHCINKLEKMSEKFGVSFIISISVDENELPEDVKSKIIISL